MSATAFNRIADGFARRTRAAASALCILLACLSMLGIARPAAAQTSAGQAPSGQSGSGQQGARQGSIRGTVRSAAGRAVGNAAVHLRGEGGEGSSSDASSATDSAGAFVFSSLSAGTYQIIAEVPGSSRSAPASVTLGEGEQRSIELVISGGNPGSKKPKQRDHIEAAPQGLEFADAPSFTIAGVTDWTAAGGHGSDASLRTAETLTRDTVAMKQGPGISNGTTPAEIESRNGPATQAAQHRVAAEAAERRGDSLTAVMEFEQATRLDPSEQNYFEWGSELLLHRAIWQAVETFDRAQKLYPRSSRVLAGLGTALFAGARYEEAAARLCDASDLDVTSETPYQFMGRVELAAPNPLPCVEERLERFAALRPADAQALYLYAMALLKGHGREKTVEATTLLKRAVQADPKCSEAYLELGILRGATSLPEAVGYYRKAIEADPSLGDAHYRLGVAYDRLGDHDAAIRELELHSQIERRQAAEIERERKEVKQFMVALPPAREPVKSVREMR